MAEKRQSSLLIGLKDVPSSKMVRMSEVMKLIMKNAMYRKLIILLLMIYSMSEADEAETTEGLQDTGCGTEITPLNCTVCDVVFIVMKHFNPLIRRLYQYLPLRNFQCTGTNNFHG